MIDSQAEYSINIRNVLIRHTSIYKITSIEDSSSQSDNELNRDLMKINMLTIKMTTNAVRIK